MKKHIGCILVLIATLVALAMGPMIVNAGSCHNVSCGCKERGISSCAGNATCWYTGTDGCSGHSWYFAGSAPATCTGEGYELYLCSICPGSRKTVTPPLGHAWGGWSCVDSSTHIRYCQRCWISQTEYHSFSGWSASGGGYYSRYCTSCGYTQTKGLWIAAEPNAWSAGNGTVSVSSYDGGVGNNYVVLYRYSYVNGSNVPVATFYHYGAGGWASNSYTETSEGVFSYTAVSYDMGGHAISASSAAIYLDHSNPVIYGTASTNTEWTNIAPVINVSATDYLYGTAYTGSGLASLIIYNDSGVAVASGTTSSAYTLQAHDEGHHLWTIVATDNVGHTSSAQVETRYDITIPGIDGTEVTEVINGVVSVYCQDNILDQHIDDEIFRSSNGANDSSGIKYVRLYKYKNGVEEQILEEGTNILFSDPDTHSYFDLYYDVNLTDEYMDYYVIEVEDFAGNHNKKKLTTQRTLLTWFHTSIDRSSYE